LFLSAEVGVVAEELLFDEVCELEPVATVVPGSVGATTGRKRRCGWLDLVALKYAIHLSGVTQLMMMKADVLSGFETLKICTGYRYKGEVIKHLPYSIDPEYVTPIYTELKGWNEDLSKVQKAKELPVELIEYIKFIEKETEVPITLVSVGADRTQTIQI